MYLPPLFREDRLDILVSCVRAHPLGLLVSAGPGGLQANPIPFLVDDESGEYGTLRAHLARANGQWHELSQVDECLVVFQGPQAYVTPSWYPTKQETGKVVPTWNYVMVHAWGRPRIMEDEAWLRRQLDELTLSREESMPSPWQVSDAPESFIAGQIKASLASKFPSRASRGSGRSARTGPRRTAQA